MAIGRIGTIAGTLLLPSLAAAVGATVSYLLVIACWLAGTVAVGIFARRGVPEAARRPLEAVTPRLSAAA